MNYFTHAAQVLRNVCNSLGLSVPPDLLGYYTLLLFTKGGDTTAKDVHNAWAAWRAVTRPDHPDLVPFADLPLNVQALDEPFAEAIFAAAGELGW